MEGFDWNDVSKYYRPNMLDQNVAMEISRHWNTPEAIRVFARRCGQLTDYSYWYLLGTLWVCYTGFSDLNMWKELFSADRRHRKDCIMKPSEVRAYDSLPYILTAYRAHRAGETDWISYTLDLDRAKKFANQRGVHEVKEYRIRRRDVLAYFTRRNESELLVLDKEKAEYVRSHYVAGGMKCEFCGNAYAEKVQQALDMLILFGMTWLHREKGYGRQRLEQYYDGVMELLKAFERDECTFTSLRDALVEETGIPLSEV